MSRHPLATCPTCGAAPGEPCVIGGQTVKAVDGHHPARMAAAFRASLGTAVELSAPAAAPKNRGRA